MFRPLAVNVGMRYARSRRSFIAFVSALSLVGLALSVAVLVFVLAVVAGFEREMNERVLAIVPHVTLTGRVPVRDSASDMAVLRRTHGVAGVSAVVEGVGLLATDERVAGVGLTGVDPEGYRDVSRVFDYVQAAAPLAAGEFRLYVGARVAERLGIGIGDRVSAVLPEVSATPFGVFPRQKRLTVAGLVDSGSQLDRGAAYLHLEDAARLFRVGDGVHGFHIAARRPLDAETVRAAAVAALGGHRYRAHSWLRSLGNLYAAIEVTRNMLFLLLSLLVAVAAFNLVSSLVMVVSERRGDIAMLRTLGSRSGLVVATFVVLGGTIALLGVAVGIGAGLALGVVAEAGFPWLEELLGTSLMSEYLITELPVEFAFGDVARVALTAMGLGLAATLFPAWRASRLNPADVLQHE